jgi:hypothetical protein
LSSCKLNPKSLKQEFLIIVSFNKLENAQEDYQKRWQIEMCFKAMKSSGFDIEKTHLHQITNNKHYRKAKSILNIG